MGFGGLGPWEIMLIFLVVLLLFGAKRLPEIGSSLGKGIREFKSSMKEIEREINAPQERESLTSGVTESGSPEQSRPVVEERQGSDEAGEPRKLRTEE